MRTRDEGSGTRAARAAGALIPPQVTARQRVARILAVFAGSVAAAAFLDLQGLRFLENEAYGLRSAIHAARYEGRADSPREQIRLVTITENTYDALGVTATTLPWSAHAKLIRELAQAGAKAIAFDMVLNRDDPEAPALARAARDYGRVVWASSFENEDTPEQKAVLPNPSLRQASPFFGHALFPTASGQPGLDRCQAVMMHQGRPIPALSFAVARLVSGNEAQPIRRTPQGYQCGDLRVQTDREGLLRMRFLGRPDETFTAVPYEDISNPVYREWRFFAGRIAIVGDCTTVNSDHYPTPVGDTWGLEVHAHALATILHGEYLGEAPPWLNLAVIGLVVALVCPCAGVCRMGRGIAATGALLAAYLIINTWLFADRGLWLHLAAPLSGGLFATVGLLADRGLNEEREKRRARGLLQRYVSPEVADHIMANPRAYVLGGKEVTATVLFADLREFTALAEHLSPTQVVECLNRYLQAMTEAVFRHQGTVDKYVGDCIMALYGAPVPHADHARRAVATALDMLSAVTTLQGACAAEGLPVLDIGIGINTGAMVVGNIGSKQRLDFTVIGDAVNLAQRVEGLNKKLGTHILVTEATYQHISEAVRARGPQLARVEGRDQEVAVYELLGWATAGSTPADTAAPPQQPSDKGP